MLRLAFSTNAFTRFPLAEAVRAIAAAGYDGVEILADVPHAYPASLDDPAIAAIARQVEQAGLAVSNINANCSFGYWKDAPPEPFFEPSLISPNPQHREDRRRMILRAIDLAGAVGAANVSITTGRTLGGMPPDRAADQLTQSLQPILDYADTAGVNVGVECEPGLFLEYAAELRDWIDRLNHPRFGANLDIGHSQVIGESVPDVVRLLAGRTWNMHVEDILGRKHYHLVPGEGTMDWRGLRSALVDTGYQRFLTVELYTCTANPHEAATQSIAFLRRWLTGE